MDPRALTTRFWRQATLCALTLALWFGVPNESGAYRAAAAPTPIHTSRGQNATIRVWVNTASGVYHCPGTRYYGNTASGEYMTESQAVQQGNRAAYGRQCDPSEPALLKAPSAAPSSAKTSRALEPAAGSPIKVWVNTSSGVYHCPGTRYYGTTKTGAYMSQAEAEAAGHRAAAGRHCS